MQFSLKVETQVDIVIEASSIFATKATRVSVPRPTLPEKGQRRHPVEQQRDLAALTAQESLFPAINAGSLNETKGEPFPFYPNWV